MEAEYDSMAEEYDATRESATDEEITAMARELDGCKTVLDVGVGTARFAKPLTDLGFEVIGIDVSRRMLMKAREKGVQQLLLADAYRLPFREKSFDAAIIIHVLHVIVDWTTAMRDIGRVTKGNVLSILKGITTPSSSTSPDPAPPPATENHGAGLGAATGYPVRTQHRMWQNEQELKAKVPPLRLERVRDEVISMSVADAIRRFQAKRSMGAQILPPQIQQQMFERLIAIQGGQTVHRRVVEDLAVWSADQLQALGP
jgi:ubiquinone/menaquinone biosynthesis C-methylase UbiE